MLVQVFLSSLQMLNFSIHSKLLIIITIFSRSSGTQLLLETFRRAPGDPRPPASRTARGSVTSHATLSDAPYSPAPLPRQLLARVAPDATPAEWTPSRPAHQRPSTACSNNTARSDAAATSVASKKRPTQVAFTREVGKGIIV